MRLTALIGCQALVAVGLATYSPAWAQAAAQEISRNAGPVVSSNTVSGSIHVTVNNGWDINRVSQSQSGQLPPASAAQIVTGTDSLVEQLRRDQEFASFLLLLTGAAGEMQVSEALTRLDTAVERGSALAAMVRAVAHFNGWWGQTAKPAEAVRLFTLAADRGLPGAQNFLAKSYWDGTNGFPASREKSTHHLRKLIDNENAERSVRAKSAQYVANRELQGLGTRKDVCAGVQTMAAAANLGNAEAMRFLGSERENEKRCLQQSSADALAWYEKGAAAGDTLSAAEAGRMHQFGLGVPRNFVLAEKFYRAASTPFADRQLSWIYLKGLAAADGQPDWKRALDYARRAANAGDGSASITVGLLFEYGLGVEQDPSEAFRWYAKAVRAGEARGVVNQVTSVVNGCVGTELMPDWLRELTAVSEDAKAGTSTQGFALNALGFVYGDGQLRVPVDQARSIKLFDKACALGIRSACQQLVRRQPGAAGAEGLKLADLAASEGYRLVGAICKQRVSSFSKDPDVFP